MAPVAIEKIPLSFKTAASHRGCFLLKEAYCLQNTIAQGEIYSFIDRPCAWKEVFIAVLSF